MDKFLFFHTYNIVASFCSLQIFRKKSENRVFADSNLGTRGSKKALPKARQYGVADWLFSQIPGSSTNQNGCTGGPSVGPFWTLQSREADFTWKTAINTTFPYRIV